MEHGTHATRTRIQHEQLRTLFRRPRKTRRDVRDPRNQVKVHPLVLQFGRRDVLLRHVHLQRDALAQRLALCGYFNDRTTKDVVSHDANHRFRSALDDAGQEHLHEQGCFQFHVPQCKVPSLTELTFHFPSHARHEEFPKGSHVELVRRVWLHHKTTRPRVQDEKTHLLPVDLGLYQHVPAGGAPSWDHPCIIRRVRRAVGHGGHHGDAIQQRVRAGRRILARIYHKVVRPSCRGHVDGFPRETNVGEVALPILIPPFLHVAADRKVQLSWVQGGSVQ
mmetsp:Transcript_9390/g.33147  ORF Transcript_9390/g.33147 Transcript_9390/m.33147 type:complete len:278 (+) Transcript_9390:418-1251(+)